MFREKNLPKLIIFTPVIAIIAITIFTIYFFIKMQNEYFIEESTRLEKEFNLKQKKLIKNQIKTIISYITHQEQIYTDAATEKVIKRTYTLSSRLIQLSNDLNLEVDSQKRKKILSNLINSKTSDTNYFFAYDVNKRSIIQPNNKDIKKEFNKDDKFFENYLFLEEGKLIQFEYSSKIVFIKYLPNLNWIIGNIEDIKVDINFIKKAALSFIGDIRFDKNGYIWIYDTNHVLISDHFRKEQLGKNESEIKVNQQYIVKDLVKKALDKEEGDYIKYAWPKPNEIKYSNKISFVQLFEKWDWVLGAGLYIDDIQESIILNKKNLENRVQKYIQYIILISLAITFFVLILSIVMSNKISQSFQNYQKKVRIKEKKLKNLNSSLQEKVLIGIKEAQKKDRAMLHQSRLARVGTMISMIAHQWRQPLSEVSGILMELETATKFKKSNDKFVLECIKDSDKLLNYMSDTIDDFRNFFKPSKQKVYFSVKTACLNALSLVNASLNDFDIKINKSFQEDVIVCGYPREFSQVILNLLLNCKDVFEDRKTINPQINFSSKIIDKEVKIIIEDNAGGINEENIDVIFEPYFTTKSSLKGTGLGLYMSNMIIEKNMNGKLNVTNSNTGAVFEIVLKGEISG